METPITDINIRLSPAFEATRNVQPALKTTDATI
jgi:hypothetical protein